MQQITYRITEIRLLRWDRETQRSSIVGRADDRTLVIEVPDEYNAMDDLGSPVCEKLEEELRREGHTFHMLNYFAYCTNGTGCHEERKNLSLVNAEALEGVA